MRAPRAFLVAVAVAAVAAAAPATATASASPGDDGAPGDGAEIVLTVRAEGDRLAIDVSDDALAGGELDAGAPLVVRWDVGALDRAHFRSDLVRVNVVGIDGPGRVTVHTPAAHGRQALVLDAAAPAPPAARRGSTMVVQLGRETTQQWGVDQAGTYRVELRASIPRADGGTAFSDRIVLGAGDVSAPTAPGVRSARPAQAGRPIVIDDGHVDIGPRIVDGAWRVQMKDDTVTPHVWRDLSEVVLHVRDAAMTTVPDRDVYAFLGAPGDRCHIAPQAQRQGTVWPGWNSQDASVIAAVPGAVTWRLRSVEGPGRFVLFITDSFGDTEVYFDTDAAMPQDLEIPRNSHVHGNWAFGAPGVYRFEVEMRATSSGGTLSDTRTLTIAVGDATDPTAVAPSPAPDPGPDAPDPDPDTDGVDISADLPAADQVAGPDERPSTTTPGTAPPAGGAGPGTTSPSRSGPLAVAGLAVTGTLAVAATLLAAGALVRAATRRTKPFANRNHS